MADIVDKSIDKVNEKLCDLYPDTEECRKKLPVKKIKIVLYITLIILGIFILKNGTKIIEKAIILFIKKFSKLIGMLLIAYGTVSLLIKT